MEEDKKEILYNPYDGLNEYYPRSKDGSTTKFSDLLKMANLPYTTGSYINTRNRLDIFGSPNAISKEEEEIYKLKQQLKAVSKDKEIVDEEMAVLIKEITAKESINHISHRISSEASDKLFNDEEFKKNFKDGGLHEAVVISIDIRRSTDLMLKAKSPRLFAEFITSLTDKLSEIIIMNYGVFDKFTGDGILAFFPKFFSGEEAIVRALKAAQECHIVFNSHYESSKNSFNVFIKDIGLGIGIDFGKVHLVNKRKELTLVGIPVVYACRLSGAKAGETLLNLSAYEELKKVNNVPYYCEETTISIKNEGEALAYKVVSKDRIIIEQKPSWLKEEFIEEETEKEVEEA